MKHFSTFWKILLAITFYARNVDAQSFEKLTDLASLKADDELLLVYEKLSTENYAMSDSIKGNTGRFRVPVTIKDSKIHDLNGAHIILLGGKKITGHCMIQWIVHIFLHTKRLTRAKTFSRLIPI